jgi:hypothetical protein
VSQEPPDWMPKLTPLLAKAMSATARGDFTHAAALISEGVRDDPMKQYAAACLLGRVIASKAPCPGNHEGPCDYQVFVVDSKTGQRKQWDDVSKAQLFTVQFVMAMLHLDTKAAKELYLQALKDKCFTDGFTGLLIRAAETVQGTSKQSITWI